MQAMMNMMMKVLKTGTMAVATAERILRRERKRPKRRRTRRARITRTMPVDVLARRRDTSDMATTKASNKYLRTTRRRRLVCGRRVAGFRSGAAAPGALITTQSGLSGASLRVPALME